MMRLWIMGLVIIPVRLYSGSQMWKVCCLGGTVAGVNYQTKLKLVTGNYNLAGLRETFRDKTLMAFLVFQCSGWTSKHFVLFSSEESYE